MNYRELALAGLVNLGFVVVVVAHNVRSSESIWQQARQQQTAMDANAATQRANAQTQASIADAYQQNGIRPPASTFTFLDYSYNPQMPPQGIDWSRSFDPRQRVQLFDMNQRCIGYIEGGSLHFLGTESTACN